MNSSDSRSEKEEEDPIAASFAAQDAGRRGFLDGAQAARALRDLDFGHALAIDGHELTIDAAFVTAVGAALPSSFFTCIFGCSLSNVVYQIFSCPL